MSERTPVLVLGLGNVVCTDDGAGIAAIHVNAAIEQLKKNLSIVAVDEEDVGESRLFFPERNE